MNIYCPSLLKQAISYALSVIEPGAIKSHVFVLTGRDRDTFPFESY